MRRPLSTSEKLIGREKQGEEIAGTLHALVHQEVGFQGLEFYGLAGIGKSRILDEAKAQCREKSLAFAVIDFLSPSRKQQAEKLSALVRLCDQLDQHLPVQRLRGTLTAASRSDGGEAFDKAIAAFRGELGTLLGEQPLVLMLDSLELCTDELFNWLGREVIAPLAEEPGSLALMLGSRGARVRESRWPAVLKARMRSFRLDPLDFQATALHISGLPGGEPYKPAVKHIYDLSIGHPFSTESLVAWLKEMGVPVEEVSMSREDLAQRLYEEVIRRYVLAQAEEWVLPMLEVASIPRWFDAALLNDLVSQFRPEVGGAQPIQYYVARISDLIDLHLVDLSEGQVGYQEEPTLRRLLNAVLTVLQPQEMAALHERAIEARAASLRREVDAKAFYALEMLYHLTQKAFIEAPYTLDEMLPGRLEVLLQGHFLAVDGADVVQVTQLRHRLRDDRELRALVPEGVFEKLEAAIERFLKPPVLEYEVGYLVLEHFPPTEYRVSWYRAGQVVLPTESVHTGIHFPLEDWRTDPNGTGQAACRVYLPRRAQDYLRAPKEVAIQLQTDWADIPWELLHNGEDFLCLKCPLARQPKLLREPRESRMEEQGRFRALVIGNPTGDLPGAEKEARVVAEMLQKRDLMVELLLGDEATPEEVSIRLVATPYHLIHFAGHGYFEKSDPRRSGLVLGGGRVVCGEELERVLSGQPFVFLSACEAGAGKTEVSQMGFWGKHTEGVAVSALLGGAIGCLGPMWAIGDGIAKEFALEFYRRLLEGLPIGEATRRARIWAREQVNPDFWAAWILYGDPLRRLPTST
jgi:hypothetical protein